MSSVDIFSLYQGSLREHAERVDDYVVPHGDWFEIVSSPHYLAEIVISLISLSFSHTHGETNLYNYAKVWHFCVVMCFLQMMKVIYAGLLVASGGEDLTIWLLFGFVVLFHPLEHESVLRYAIMLCFVTSSILRRTKFMNWVVGRWQILYLQQQRHTGGIGVNLTIIQVTDMLLFLLFTSTCCIFDFLHHKL